MAKISDLSITIAEVTRASNIKIMTINILYKQRKFLLSKPSHIKYLPIVVLSMLLVAAVVAVLSRRLEPFFYTLVGVATGSIQTIIEEKFRNRYKHFLKLYIQIINFNSLIESAEALDEAGRSGGSNRLENREKVIKALTSIRADLIAAVKIEKAFRENPNFSSSSFTLNLEPLQFLQLSEQSSEYGRLFNEALQIGLNVQEEMQTLQRRY